MQPVNTSSSTKLAPIQLLLQNFQPSSFQASYARHRIPSQHHLALFPPSFLSIFIASVFPFSHSAWLCHLEKYLLAYFSMRERLKPFGQTAHLHPKVIMIAPKVIVRVMMKTIQSSFAGPHLPTAMNNEWLNELSALNCLSTIGCLSLCLDGHIDPITASFWSVIGWCFVHYAMVWQKLLKLLDDNEHLICTDQCRSLLGQSVRDTDIITITVVVTIIINHHYHHILPHRHPNLIKSLIIIVVVIVTIITILFVITLLTSWKTKFYQQGFLIPRMMVIIMTIITFVNFRTEHCFEIMRLVKSEESEEKISSLF